MIKLLNTWMCVLGWVVVLTTGIATISERIEEKTKEA